MANVEPLPVVIAASWQVDQMLRDIGLTRQIVREIALAAASARADALAVDPSGTPGTLSYIHGVRTTRLKLVPRKWRVSREGHVESTVNDNLGVQLCFQNVDRACSHRDPQAVSAKGSSSRELVKSGQMDLFDKPGEKNAAQLGRAPTVWLICVSADNDSIRAEVSCPKVFEGDQFEGFIRRLFVVNESITPKPTRRNDSDDGDLDLDIPVSKK
jgi:hypothetical protein